MMDMVNYLSIKDVEFMAHGLAVELMGRNEPIPPFETRYPAKLESCLETPGQTFGGKDLYPTLVNKAAALFYLMIKNHPFQNGNKRVAVTTMLVFLYRNEKWLKVADQSLYLFAVWVAQSPPELKDAVLQGINDFIGKNLVARTQT